MTQISIEMPPELLDRLDAIESKISPVSKCPEFWTLDQVAAEKGVTLKTVQRWASHGKYEIHHTKHGRRIHRDDV